MKLVIPQAVSVIISRAVEMARLIAEKNVMNQDWVVELMKRVILQIANAIMFQVVVMEPLIHEKNVMMATA
jgi:hypothetical protein